MLCCCESEEECEDNQPFCCCESEEECEDNQPFCCCEAEEECEDGRPFCCCEEDNCECRLGKASSLTCQGGKCGLKKKKYVKAPVSLPVQTSKIYSYKIEVKVVGRVRKFFVNGKESPDFLLRKTKNYSFEHGYDQRRSKFIIHKKGNRKQTLDLTGVVKGSELEGEYVYTCALKSAEGGLVLVK